MNTRHLAILIAPVLVLASLWMAPAQAGTADVTPRVNDSSCTLTESDGDPNSAVVEQCLAAETPPQGDCSPISSDGDPNSGVTYSCVAEVGAAQIVASDGLSDAAAAAADPGATSLQEMEETKAAAEQNVADAEGTGQGIQVPQIRNGVVYADTSGDALSPGIPGTGVTRVDNTGTPGPYVDDPCRNLDASTGCIAASSQGMDDAGNEILTEFEFVNKGEIPVPVEALLAQPDDFSASTAQAGNPRFTNISCYSAEATARTKYIARIAGRVVNSYTLVRLTYGLDYCGNKDRGYFTFRKKRYLHQEVNGYRFFGYRFGPDSPSFRPRGGGPEGEFSTQTDTTLVYAPFWDTQIRCTWASRNGTENAHLGATLFGGSATWRSDYGAPPTEIKYRRTQ